MQPKRIILFLIVLFSYASSIQGQDLHYSQFYNAHLNVNPGLTGIFNGDVRLNGNYRSQWNSVPVPYMTFSGGADLKFYPKTGNNFFSGGALFNYDQAGDSKLRLAQLGLSGSYTYAIDTKNLFTAGLQFGFAQRAFKTSDLTFDNQYTGAKYEPGLPTGENFDRTGAFIFDISGGLNYRWQKSSRSKLDLGIGVFHINRPNNPFYKDDDVKLLSRMSLTALSSFKLSNSFDLLVNAIAQFQGPYEEMLIQAAGKIYINQKKGKEFALELGAGYRFGDAFYPELALHFRSLAVGVSYDINTSLFDIATDGRGGPEFFVTYIIKRVKPLSQRKVCPIF